MDAGSARAVSAPGGRRPRRNNKEQQQHLTQRRPATSQGFGTRSPYESKLNDQYSIVPVSIEKHITLAEQTGGRQTKKRAGISKREGLDIAKLGNELAACEDYQPDLILRGIQSGLEITKSSSGNVRTQGPDPLSFPIQLLNRSYDLHRSYKLQNHHQYSTDAPSRHAGQHSKPEFMLKPSSSVPFGKPCKTVNLEGWKACAESLAAIGYSNPHVISFKGCYELHLTGIVSLVSKLRLTPGNCALQHVDLSGWVAPEKEVDTGVALLVACAGVSLKSLELSNTELSDIGLVAIGKRCEHLTHLDVSYCKKVTDEGISAVMHPPSVRKVARLRTLRIAFCSKVRGRWNLLAGLGNRVELGLCEIEKCDLNGCKRFESIGILELAQSSQGHLREINANYCSNLDDTVILQAAPYLPRLNKLELQECHRITDEAMLALATSNIAHLESINISGTQVTDIGLSALAEAFSFSLRELYASMPRPVNFVRNAKLLEVGTGALSRLSYSKDEQKAMLQVRKLAELKQSRRGRWVAAQAYSARTGDDESDSEVIESQNAFRALDIENHTLFPADSLMLLCRGSAQFLVHLSVAGNQTITAEHLRFLFQACPRLSGLNLARCEQIGDSAVQVICESGSNLIQLDISRAVDEQLPLSISNQKLSWLILKCTQLVHLKARYQLEFSFNIDEQLQQKLKQEQYYSGLFSSSASMENMDLSGCINLKRGGIARILQTFSNLKSLELSYCPQILLSDMVAVRRPDLLIAEAPEFGFVQNESSWLRQSVTQAWVVRNRLEEEAAHRIQKRYRLYKAAPVTLEYLILCNLVASQAAAEVIQKQWAQYRIRKQILTAVHRIWAIRVMQRFFRCRLWRKRVYTMLQDDVARERREWLAAKMKREFLNSRTIQVWYRRILWERSPDGLWHAELQRQAKIELAWRRQTKLWRGQFAKVYLEAANEARSQQRFRAGMMIASFETPIKAKRGARTLLCAFCRRVRSDLWCALCQYSLCNTCAWGRPSHRRHVEACLDTRHSNDLFRYITEPVEIEEFTKRLGIGEFLDALQNVNIALGEARDYIAKRQAVLCELRRRFAVRHEDKKRRKAEEYREQQRRIEDAAILVQRNFRAKLGRHDFAVMSAAAVARQAEIQKVFHADAATKIQAMLRGIEPRNLWQRCKAGPLRSFIDIKKQQAGMRKIYGPFLLKLSRHAAHAKRANVRWLVEELQKDQATFRTNVLEVELLRTQERLARAREAFKIAQQDADMAAQRATELLNADVVLQKRSRHVAEIATATHDHARQTFELLDRLIVMIESSLGEVEEERLRRALAVYTFCHERADHLFGQIEKLEFLKKNLQERKEEIVTCLSEHQSVANLFDRYGDPKLMRLTRTKKEIAARHEFDWISIKLGERLISDVMAERRIEEASAANNSAAGGQVNREALAARSDSHIPAEVDRYWDEIYRVLSFVEQFVIDYGKLEQRRRELFKKLLPTHTYLLAFFDEAREMAIERAKFDHQGKHAKSLQIAKQETAIRAKIMQLHDEIKRPALDLAADLRKWERKSNALVLPSLTKGYTVSIPETCMVEHKVSIKGLYREIKSAAWTSLLPGRFFADEQALDADRQLQARIQGTLNARKAEGEGSDESSDEAGENDDSENEGQAAATQSVIDDSPAGLAAALIRDAKIRQDNTLFSRLRNWWNQSRDEAAALEQSVLRRQRTSAAVFIAIAADFAFTVGSIDYSEMQREQALRDEQGLPMLRPYSKNIGSDVPIHFWFRTTMEAREMLTGLKISHASSKSELYWEDKPGWKRTVHEKMNGDPRAPALQFLYQSADGMINEAPSRFIKAIRVSTSKEDENHFAEEGFERIGEDLGTYFLVPEAYFWILYDSPDENTKALCESEERELLNRQELEKKKAQIEAILENKPESRGKYQRMLVEINGKLDRLETIEAKEHRELVARAAEFLALTKKELQKLVRLFASMDNDGSGKVSHEELLSFIGVDSTDVAMRIFNFLDDNHDGEIDFPEFMNIISTFCMFGNKEVARMCFSFLGPNEDMQAPVMAAQQFISSLHQVDVDEVPLLKASVEYLRNQATGMNLISLDTFYTMNRLYPKTLYPAMVIRDAMRSRFMGTRWWTRKLERYAKARQQLELKQKKQKLERELLKEKALKLPEIVSKSQSSSSLSSSSSSSASSI